MPVKFWITKQEKKRKKGKRNFKNKLDTGEGRGRVGAVGGGACCVDPHRQK